MGTSISQKLKDRKNEDRRFEQEELPIEVIRKVRIKIEDDNDFVVLFENKERKYGFYVVVQDNDNLGWKECRAIADVLRIGARGTKITNDSFLALSYSLKKWFGKIDCPSIANGRLVTEVRPGRGGFRKTSDDTIVRTGVSFNEDGNLLIYSVAAGGQKYGIMMQLSTRDGALYEADCKALVDIMGFLETGDDVSKHSFLIFGLYLRMEYNHVQLKSGNDLLVLSVLASDVKNNAPVDSLLAKAFEEELKRRVEESDSEGYGASIDSPYPGVSFTSKIKEGGQRKVFAGIHQGEKVAVKIFDVHLSGEDARNSYKTELRMLLRLSEHPNVVEVLDFFEAPRPALVMHLIEGEDLKEYLHRMGGMNVSIGRKTAIGIAEGLCHIHKHGVVHRDLKSSNIIRKSDGTPVITELGLGSIIERRSKGSSDTDSRMATYMSSTHVFQGANGGKGTLFWMPPEMIKNQEWSNMTDVYAFGVIMWEVFTGKTPFVPEDGRELSSMDLLLEIAHGKRPDMSAVRHIDRDLQQIMELCWQTDPKKRPSMQRVLDLLKQKGSGEAGTAANRDQNDPFSRRALAEVVRDIPSREG